MEIYCKRKSSFLIEGNNDGRKSSNVEFNVAQLSTNPRLRIPILNYNVNIRDQIRRVYFQRGPYQPQNHNS